MKKFKRIIMILIAATMLSGVVSAEAARGADAQPRVKLPIVMYHHLSPKARLLGDYVLSPEALEADFKYLKDNGYESITVTELIQWTRGEGELPEKPVMITFDDGYESTQVYAGPLLEKYGFRAVVAIVGAVADLFTEKPDHMLDYSHLSWDAVRELSRSYTFEIQCHTYNMHKNDVRRGCGKKNGEDFLAYKSALEADLVKFREKCFAEGVICASAIAFPYGFYSKDTLEVVRELGFDAAFTCSERVNYLSGDPEELFELCRYNRPSGVTASQFFGRWQ